MRGKGHYNPGSAHVQRMVDRRQQFPMVPTILTAKSTQGTQNPFWLLTYRFSVFYVHFVVEAASHMELLAQPQQFHM